MIGQATPLERDAAPEGVLKVYSQRLHPHIEPESGPPALTAGEPAVVTQVFIVNHRQQRAYSLLQQPHLDLQLVDGLV